MQEEAENSILLLCNVSCRDHSEDVSTDGRKTEQSAHRLPNFQI
jgi:hypothetical protein